MDVMFNRQEYVACRERLSGIHERFHRWAMRDALGSAPAHPSRRTMVMDLYYLSEANSVWLSSRFRPDPAMLA